MQISVWTNSPSLRDIISSAVDVALAQIRFLTLPDGFGGRLIYKNSMVIDTCRKMRFTAAISITSSNTPPQFPSSARQLSRPMPI